MRKPLWTWLLVLVVGISADDFVPYFQYEFKNNESLFYYQQYSGYLDDSFGNNLHYWLSKREVARPDLLLWLGSGTNPGCSALGSFFSEIGPYRATSYGSLVENAYTWNTVADILTIDAPNIGFSYSEKNKNPFLTDDDQTISSIINALWSFLKRYPGYGKAKLHIGGQGYASVYATLLMDALSNADFSFSTTSLVIGNAQLSKKIDLNARINLLYYRGIIDKREFDKITMACCAQNTIKEYCDFSADVAFDSQGQPSVRKDGNQDCATLVINYGYDKTDRNQDTNYYQGCYQNPEIFSMSESGRRKRYSAFNQLTSTYSNGDNPFIDQKAFINSDTTDSSIYPCYANNWAEQTINLLRNAFEISKESPYFRTCTQFTGKNQYKQLYADLTNKIVDILNKGKSRVLIYGGDASTASSFLHQQWFVEQLPKTKILADRVSVNFTRPQGTPTVSGFHSMYEYLGQSAIHLVTVKGAGQSVAVDRPGPAQQIFNNFVLKVQDFSTPQSFLEAPVQNEERFTRRYWTRKQADRIWELPGLTFPIQFKQYSGYLKSHTRNTNYESYYANIHYWLVESQSNPLTDPLVVWLNSGTGCSSLGGLLHENGPFHPNPDGKTLYENVNSWNKVANLLYIDAPHGTGFSFANTTDESKAPHSDENILFQIAEALVDFVKVYPEYKNRPLYFFGEGHGGSLMATLTAQLIDMGLTEIFNIQGIGIGNGELSVKHQLNSAIHYLYFHGILGKKEWNSLIPCCNKSVNDSTWFEYCDFSQYVTIDGAGKPSPVDDSQCAKSVVEFANERVWNTLNNAFNLYEECYTVMATLYGTHSLRSQPAAVLKHIRENIQLQQDYANDETTDSLGGFPCYAGHSSKTWLNRKDVREALHIPDEAPKWVECNPNIIKNYKNMYTEMAGIFNYLMNSTYPFRMIVYNGDLDMAANFMGDQWFIEEITKSHQFVAIKPYGEWDYRQAIAGYNKKFTNYRRDQSIEFATVKGAGHFAPRDRPGPLLQLFGNFIRDQPIDTPLVFGEERTELKTQYKVKQRATRMNQAKTRVKRGSTKFPDAPPPPKPTTKEEDFIKNLPNLSFKPTFDQYSGYLKASEGNYLFYWLTESQANPKTDPLVLWLNGGPGCSAIIGLFKEHGPFHPNHDNNTMFENVFSFNKFANMLFIESPRDVGFSYRASDVPPDDEWTDLKSAIDVVLALDSFYKRFPEYNNKEFYITGESYGGVYVPTTADYLLQQLVAGKMSYINLQGFAIGNGILNEYKQINSAISLTYYRGFEGKAEYDRLKQCCKNTSIPMTYCDFQQYVGIDPAGYPYPKKTDGSTEAECGKYVIQQGYNDVWFTSNAGYNTYMDEYSPKHGNAYHKQQSRTKRSAQPLRNDFGFVDQAEKVDYDYTDANMGFYYWVDCQGFMNLPQVREAIHAAPNDRGWNNCYDYLDRAYTQNHFDTSAVYESIMKSAKSLKKPIRVMFFEGDVDIACQFLMSQWFVEDLAEVHNMDASKRTSWIYTHPGVKDPKPALGGYNKRFHDESVGITFDYVTIKGGGHFVARDRPGPALQVMYNFIHGTSNYSTMFPYSVEPQPTYVNFTNLPADVSRADQDQVYELPGLTFDLNFTHYAGYLHGNNDNDFLFHWFLQSQNLPLSDPVVIWLNGGPGCSSLIGMFSEIGPFYPNQDGQTLFENTYSWNKAANLLFIDSPRMVGFSYQKENNTVYNDNNFVDDLVAAIEDFRQVHPEFSKNQYFIAGESYGGIYLPILARALVRNIKDKKTDINFQGMMIGNGYVSRVRDVQTLPDMLYFHGLYSKKDFDSLKNYCLQFTKNGDCDYSEYVKVTDTGDLVARNFTGNDAADKTSFANIIVDLADQRLNSWGMDPHNPLQDCYATDYTKTRSATASTRAAFDPVSTDPSGGFPCYAFDALQSYLARDHVRDAINVPDYVQQWTMCSTMVENNYKLLYDDTSAIFADIFNSGYPLRILLYNGDVDAVCGFMQAQKFVDSLVAQNPQFTVTGLRHPWMYSEGQWTETSSVAGYVRQFSTGDSTFTIDVMTVKGAGHTVPTDRPGPSLQLFTNFLYNRDYSTPHPWSTSRLPLKPQFMERNEGVNTTASPIPTAATQTPHVVTSPQTPAPTKPSKTTSQLGSLGAFVMLFMYCLLA